MGNAEDGRSSVELTRRGLIRAMSAASALSLVPPFLGSAFSQDDHDLGPKALNGSHEQAYASHHERMAGIARAFATLHPLAEVSGKATENNTLHLIGHCQAVRDDPTFVVPGQPPSRDSIPTALRRLNKGDGLVGTRRDYDMALKGLMTVAYRYPDLLNEGGVDFILDALVPDGLSGRHPPEIEILEVTFLNIDIPETENHLLMIESTRYLVNQLKRDRGGGAEFDNRSNGLARWLTQYLQTIAQHDFLEFNARPYARLALHPIFNLYEFARDAEVKTAAHIVLDYTMMKFAVGSSRGRRVAPFRRLQHRINHVANERNFLFSPLGDQVTGMFTAFTGLLGPDFSSAGFFDTLLDNAIIAGLSSYRPPTSAYIVGMDPSVPASMHIVYHGTRPQLRGSGDVPEGGFEIYYKSPSFLITAGGAFLNSGYGSDEFDIGVEAWEQTARAQATTLIPARADTLFHDLVRFEPYPDPQVDPYADDPEDPDTLRSKGVANGVARNLAAGGNLRPAEKKTILENSSSDSPSLALHNDTLFMAWKGSGNDNLNVARVLATRLLGIDGVEGLEWKRILSATSDTAPAITSHNGRLFIAWKGAGNENLNLAFSEDNGLTFKGATTFGDTSDYAPTLASFNGGLYYGWTGEDDHLNVARVTLFGNTAGGFGIEGLTDKVVLGDTSDAAPALCAHNGRLFLAFKGSGNDNINLIVSSDGRGFGGKATFGDTSSHGLSLASHQNRLYLGWKGSGNENLNVARVVLIGNTSGAFGIEGLEAKVTLGETSDSAPTLGSWKEMLFLGWTGEGSELLNLRVSPDGSFRPVGPWFFSDLTHLGFYLAAYRAPPTHPDQLVEPLDNLALVYAVEVSDMASRGLSFAGFRDRTIRRNLHLPPALDYGGVYRFHAPDDRDFSIWFELTGDKYNPRVVELGRPVDRFSSFPLVSGEYMSAPGGHDGLIELRHPGCEGTPIVLDFRNIDAPRRSDDRRDCPRPWVERSLALFAVARANRARAMPAFARAALIDGLDIYDALLSTDPDRNGPPLAAGVIDMLMDMGVDYSVPEGDLRSWLANPQFTSYPALAQSLLLLDRRLFSPVYIDVIAWKYEHTEGVASPRARTEVRGDVLLASLLSAYNERYGSSVSDVAAILLAP